MGIGSTAVKQICLATWDLARSERCWTKVLGITPERLKTPLWDEVPSYTDGRPDAFVAQDFLVYRLEGGMVLEIFGPGDPDQPNPWRAFLDKHGEGVMNIAFYVPDRGEAYQTLGTPPYHEGFYPGGTYTFVDAFSTLGVELNIKRDEDNTALIAAIKANREE